MLKKFFMSALSSFIGAWIALVLFGVVVVLVCVGVVAKLGVSSSSAESVSKGSVLSIELSGVIQERETPLDIDYISLVTRDSPKPKTLSSLTMAVREAKVNKNISAIYLKCGMVSAAPATLNALRDVLNDFRESGKKIVAYADTYTNGSYFVASVADSVFLNPAGSLMIQGIGGTSLYYKNLLDKLGVEMQVVKVGTYKSAVEPYIMNEMSTPARAQLDTLYGNIWKFIRTGIAKERKKVTASSIDSLVSKDFVFISPAEDDVENGLVDRLVYERSMDGIIAGMLGKEEKKLNFVSVQTLLSQTTWGQAYTSKDQVAVVYATGEIVDGGGAGTINYQKLVPTIIKLADNDKVKGMVLRVNSPGGAVFGSKQIADALDYFQSKGKSLAVSMGDYAASGGYWISCCSDKIFADPLTITGSIGIFGLIPNVSGLAEKIGVTPQTVSTNPEADFPAFYKPMDEKQYAVMQHYIERGYDEFIKRVSDGRKMDEAKVRQIGEGRVWDAQKAKEIGLVDELGSLQDALEWVAEKEELGEKWSVAVYPSVESSIWEMIPELADIKLNNTFMKALSGKYDEIAVKCVIDMLRQKPLQARMPYIEVRMDNAMSVN
ncbi:MAG: signal peptide peptidase SppA [Muribaculaceae bacterium]|nr:signal peptide peptidase SppA [Muribaculaceae bacterium]